MLLLALGLGAAAWAVERGALDRRARLALVMALCLADLARAGAGQNPQEQPSFFDPLPEVAALRLARSTAGASSPTASTTAPRSASSAARGGPALELTSLFLHRQILGPYANVLDRVEAPEAMAPAALLPRPRERGAELYDTARVGELLPWLRNAGVARVLSLDPLSDPELVPLASIPAGPPGVAIHAYGFESWPRASLACRATPVASREQALGVPYRKGFDPWREVALEEQGGGPDDALPATCTKGRARRTWSTAGRGALRGRDQRERLPRGAREPRARLAGARRRRARRRCCARTASTARWRCRRGATRWCCATRRPASSRGWR